MVIVFNKDKHTSKVNNLYKYILGIIQIPISVLKVVCKQGIFLKTVWSSVKIRKPFFSLSPQKALKWKTLFNFWIMIQQILQKRIKQKFTFNGEKMTEINFVSAQRFDYWI
jgi:hypothetical protein